MKFYELTYLLNPGIKEEEIKNIVQKINEFIRKEGGIIDKEEPPTKKKLGHPIKKFGEAFVANLKFNLSPDKIPGLEDLIKKNNQVLSRLIFAKEIKKRGREIRRRNLAKKFLPQKIKITPFIKQPPKPEKVELKEIEKKLEEILRE